MHTFGLSCFLAVVNVFLKGVMDLSIDLSMDLSMGCRWADVDDRLSMTVDAMKRSEPHYVHRCAFVQMSCKEWRHPPATEWIRALQDQWTLELPFFQQISFRISKHDGYCVCDC